MKKLSAAHPTGKPTDRKFFALVAATASIVTVTLLIGIKAVAFALSGSVSVLGTLIDSIMDAVVSAVNFMAIRYSLKPADHEHRYGHGKIEGLAALFQAAFIAGAGAFLVLESLRRFGSPAASAEESGLVLVIMAVSVVLTVMLIIIQRAALARAPSLAVEAEKAHYVGDIAVNAGVVVVLLALDYGAPAWIDPFFAVVIALHLWRTAWEIAFKGLDMILDRELPDDSRRRILSIITTHPDVLGVHDLRTRKSGMDVHIAFDIEIDPDVSLRAAHEVAIGLERDLLAVFPGAEIMIHKDPAGVAHIDSRHQVAGVHD